MKRFRRLSLLIALGLLFDTAAHGQDASGITTAFVYKADGTEHCSAAPGATLELMAEDLTRSDIRVYSQRKSHDGREGIALCGRPTGSVNVYEIAESDLPEAIQLGFDHLDPAWLAPRK